jgi:hypothetical protein
MFTGNTVADNQVGRLLATAGGDGRQQARFAAGGLTFSEAKHESHTDLDDIQSLALK